MLSVLLFALSFPVEGVVFFSLRARVSEARLLEGCDVDVESKKLSVKDPYLSCIKDF